MLGNFFHTYLTDRQQCVSIGNTLSDSVPVTSGVPQGSILGPLLFIVYINDLPSRIQHSMMDIYADDTKCGKEVNSPQDRCVLLQSDIDAISSWSNDSQLLLHELKTCLVRFCSNKVHPVEFNYLLNSNSILVRSSYKDLGVTFSNDLTWNSHIDNIIAKAYRVLFLIKRTFSVSSPMAVKKRLYQSLILPMLTYTVLQYGAPI